MCHCDWLNNELNGQYLGRKRLGGTSGDREDSGEEESRVTNQMLNKQDLQNGDEVTSTWKNTDQKIWVNLSYKS